MPIQPTLIGVLLSLSIAVRAAEPPASPPSVFDLPRIQTRYALLQAATAALFQKGDYAAGEKSCRAAVQLIPHDANAHYNLACALARQGKTDEALASLEKAVDMGFRDPDHIKNDDDLASLRQQDRLKKAVENAAAEKSDRPSGWHYQVEPAEIKDAVATVDENNTAWDAKRGVLRPLFKLGTAPPADTPIAKGFGEAGKLLIAWQAELAAAGNRGDLYDNHDSDHSNMNHGMFPQLTRIEFAEAAKSRRLHHGLQASFLFNGVTIGNSSTAVTSGPFWRSQPRLALTNPRGAAMLYLQYMSNHLYFYPEHRDHDPGPDSADGKGHGDVFAMNTPYLIISQGSSGSDRAFLNAVAATLAAFRPDVKAELTRTGTVMPTVQMIFRSSNKQVTGPEDYLSGKAHPTVFDGSQIDPVKMVTLAHEITKDKLPPVVQLKVAEEDQPVAGRDFFSAAAGERLFDTPCAIARVARSTQYARRMVVSAEASKDLNGHALTYHWSVLRGDAQRIKINKLNDAGSVVELLIPYHERSPIAPGSQMQSSRVDIGAFVHNGTYYSAPAFVTFFFLDNERRGYDDQHRIQVVDYADATKSKNYVDPTIHAAKRWRDEYDYDDSGKLTGWTRIRGGEKEQFTADGLLISPTDAEGQPTEARRVRYVVKREQNRAPVLEQVTTDEVVPLLSPADRR
jgi:YD repeat-containing protein